MSAADTSPTPERSHPLSVRLPIRQIIETTDDDSQAREAFLQHLVVKQPYHQHRGQRKSNTNYTSSTIGSIADRTPSTLIELKQQRLLAAADRNKRIIARIVSIVGVLIILLCAAIVTFTLKMAPKIDELVRSKVGVYQNIPLATRMNTLSTTTTTTTTLFTTSRQDNSTINRSVTGKFLSRTRRKPLM